MGRILQSLYLVAEHVRRESVRRVLVMENVLLVWIAMMGICVHTIHVLRDRANLFTRSVR